jgi:phosphatidylglycerophosphate synthase
MVNQISRQPTARIVHVPAEGGRSPARIWGMTGAERLERILRRANAGSDSNPSVFLRDDFVYDEVLVRALLAKSGVVLMTGEGMAVALHASGDGGDDRGGNEDALRRGAAEAGLRPVDAVTLASTYNKTLRKRAVPYLLRIGGMPAIAIERRMFDGAYKGVTDFVTKRVWPRPAFHVTRLCARLGVSPNLVTAISLVCVLAATGLFWQAQFALGLICAWAMCFLDTVDGKLARVTLRSTPFGNIFDHGIDLIHPPFWYWAWYEGVTATGHDHPELMRLALILIILGYVGGRLQEGLFTLLFGIEIHIWRPLDSWFREITARRNPNLFILTVATILGAPGQGFIAVAFWTAICFIFHTIRILQALLAKAMGKAPVSWLSEPIAQASRPLAS